MGEFVDSPMTGEFQKQGNVPEGSPGEYDKDPCPEFGAYPRTKGGAGVPEKFFEKSMPNPSGEPDQY